MITTWAMGRPHGRASRGPAVVSNGLSFSRGGEHGAGDMEWGDLLRSRVDSGSAGQRGAQPAAALPYVAREGRIPRALPARLRTGREAGAVGSDRQRLRVREG